jgi:uncharacterized C2H2 Zn-finger protein
LGLTIVSRETRKLTAPVIKQEEASKYRCKECNKLFKAPEFVIKHVAVKHTEIVKPKLDDVSDPFLIAVVSSYTWLSD